MAALKNNGKELHHIVATMDDPDYERLEHHFSVRSNGWVLAQTVTKDHSRYARIYRSGWKRFARWGGPASENPGKGVADILAKRMLARRTIAKVEVY